MSTMTTNNNQWCSIHQPTRTGRRDYEHQVLARLNRYRCLDQVSTTTHAVMEEELRRLLTKETASHFPPPVAGEQLHRLRHTYAITITTVFVPAPGRPWVPSSTGLENPGDPVELILLSPPPFHHSQKYWRPTIPLQLSSGIREVCNRAGNTEPPLSSSQEITYPLPPTTM